MIKPSMSRDRHFIKEKLDGGIICLPYVKSASQVAVILIKGPSEKLFSVFCSKMGLHDVFAPSSRKVLVYVFVY